VKVSLRKQKDRSPSLPEVQPDLIADGVCNNYEYDAAYNGADFFAWKGFSFSSDVLVAVCEVTTHNLE
jgi:hypothetical protein